LANIDQAVLVAIDKWPQQDASNQGEDGGVGTDAKGKCDHYGDSQPFRSGQGTNREFQVTYEVHKTPFSEFFFPLAAIS